MELKSLLPCFVKVTIHFVHVIELQNQNNMELY